MSSSVSEEEILMHPSHDNWNSSDESIITQRIAKLTKSDSMFKFKNYDPSLTFSQLELREMCLQNFKEKARKWQFVQNKSGNPKLQQTRSLLRDELEILRINLSVHEELVAFNESQLLKDIKNKESKRTKKLMKLAHKAPVFQKFTSHGIKDLLTEIDESESAKTDKVVWKFLDRSSSIRKEAVNPRKIFLQVQAFYVTVLEMLSNSSLQFTPAIRVTCPNCRFFVTTHVKKISTTRSKLTSLLLAIARLCIDPHFFFTFKGTVHLCPLCKIYLGFCPAFNIYIRKRKHEQQKQNPSETLRQKKMVSASSTSAKNLFVESKLRLCDRVQVNVNNIAAIARQIQRGSKANENLITAAKNFALQEAAIENSETNLKKLKLLTTHLNNQLDSLHNSSSKIETVLEQVCSMQR